MPYTVNGVGTWYYGKKNVVQYEGVCSECKSPTVFSSYDTRLFAVLIFVPVLPLGRKHILEDCGRCQRHRVLSFKEWTKAQNQTVELLEKFKSFPHDSQSAVEAIQSAVAYRDLASLLLISSEIENSAIENAELHGLTASALGFFGRDADAERLYRAAQAIEDSDEIRVALAECLISQNRPDEAVEYVAHIVEDGLANQAGTLFQLAQAYQVIGDHESAIHWFEHSASLNSSLAQDKTFRQLREASEKNRGTQKKIRPRELVLKRESADSRRKFLRVASIVLLVGALAWCGAAWYYGLNRAVYLASGIDQPYHVLINGEEYELGPHALRKIHVHEGQLTVQVKDGPLATTEESVVFRTPFLTRPINKSTIVVNPDRAAILERTRAYYSASKNNSREPEVSYSTNQILLQFDDVDHPFERLPEKLSVSSSRSTSTRTGLSLRADNQVISDGLFYLGLADSLGKNTMADVARRKMLTSDPIDEYVGAISRLLEPREAAITLEPALTLRPLRMNAHRTYQEMMKKSGQVEQVEQFYDSMLTADPTNNELKYLAARTTRDFENGVALTKAAADGEPPCAFAQFSMAAYHLANGEFEPALTYVESAAQKLPDDVGVQHYLKLILCASKHFGRVIALSQKDQHAPFPYFIHAFEDQVFASVAMGNDKEAQSALEGLLWQMETIGWDGRSQHMNTVKADLAYVQGDVTKFVELSEGGDTPYVRFIAAITKADFEAVEHQLGRVDDVDGLLHLQAYIGASVANQRELADRCLAQAIERMSKAEVEPQVFAAALLGQPIMSIDLLIRQRGKPAEKAVWLVALGLREPGVREKCFSLARKLNFDKRYPHRLLASAMDGQTSP